MIQIANNNQILLDGEVTKYYTDQNFGATTVYTTQPYAEIDMPRDRYAINTPDGMAELERDIRAIMAAATTPAATGHEAEICAEIAQRQALGLSKYGTTVADAGLSLPEWLQHLKEELMDAAIYAQAALHATPAPTAIPAPPATIAHVLKQMTSALAYLRVDSTGWQRLIERACTDLGDLAAEVQAGKRQAYTHPHLRHTLRLHLHALASAATALADSIEEQQP